MIKLWIAKFLASKGVTIILMVVCTTAGAYIMYVISEKDRLESEVSTLTADNKVFNNEITRLNRQIEINAKADKVSKQKIKVNKVIVRELESDEKKVLATELPNPLISRMCKLGQIAKTSCKNLD